MDIRLFRSRSRDSGETFSRVKIRKKEVPFSQSRVFCASFFDSGPYESLRGRLTRATVERECGIFVPLCGIDLIFCCEMRSAGSRGPQPPAAKARLNPGTEDRKKQCLRAFPRNTRLLAGLRRCDPLSTIKNDFRKLSSRSRRGLWAVKKHKEKESPKRFGKMQSERLPVRRHPRRRTATRRKLGQSSAGGEPQNPHERFLEPRRT